MSERFKMMRAFLVERTLSHCSFVCDHYRKSDNEIYPGLRGLIINRIRSGHICSKPSFVSQVVFLRALGDKRSAQYSKIVRYFTVFQTLF